MASLLRRGRHSSRRTSKLHASSFSCVCRLRWSDSISHCQPETTRTARTALNTRFANARRAIELYRALQRQEPLQSHGECLPHIAEPMGEGDVGVGQPKPHSLLERLTPVNIFRRGKRGEAVASHRAVGGSSDGNKGKNFPLQPLKC